MMAVLTATLTQMVGITGLLTLGTFNVYYQLSTEDQTKVSRAFLVSALTGQLVFEFPDVATMPTEASLLAQYITAKKVSSIAT